MGILSKSFFLFTELFFGFLASSHVGYLVLCLRGPYSSTSVISGGSAVGGTGFGSVIHNKKAPKSGLLVLESKLRSTFDRDCRVIRNGRLIGK